MLLPAGVSFPALAVASIWIPSSFVKFVHFDTLQKCHRCHKSAHLSVGLNEKDAPSKLKLPRGPGRALQVLLACCGALIVR